MSGATSELSVALNQELRTIVAAIDRAIACLQREGTAEDHRAATRDLVAARAELVEALALGPAPEVRACPECKHTGMLAATRCGYCWVELSPLSPSARGMVQ